jgi:membrane protein YdbS with pleckstrin-like domain
MSFESADPGHGHSTAAWTAVTIMLIAFAIGTVAFFFEVVWLVWASAALLLVGLVAGWIMARAGYGAASVDGSH